MAAARQRVGVIGAGTIGSLIAERLDSGLIAGAELAGVVGSRSAPAGALAELARVSEIMVEAAGIDAVLGCLYASRAAGADLIVCSTGAFARPELLGWLDPDRGGPGRIVLPAGAIGGVDLLRAVALAGALQSVRLVTTKQSAALDCDPADGVRIAFEGTARAAILAHPKTANVSVTLALATLGLDHTLVRMVADPQAEQTRHEVLVNSDLGSYRFEICNLLAPGSGAQTSALTAWSALLAVQDAVQLRAAAARNTALSYCIQNPAAAELRHPRGRQ